MNQSLKRGFDFDEIDFSSLKEKKLQLKKPISHSPEPDSDTTNLVDIIFRKMEKKGGFPSFSKQISDINKILKLKYASAKDIANVIIKDFSLSNKLLKLVNSSFYGQFSDKGISSVEKAMIILGADQVQQTAASLMLFEHMQMNSHSTELKKIAVKTFMSGLIAKEIAKEKAYNDTEEFLICAMFYKLGENLIAYYFSEKREMISRLAAKVSLNKASTMVLGLSYQQLGAGIAQKWGLPDNIIKSMQIRTPEKQPAKKTELPRVVQLGLIASFSNDLCEIQFSVKPEERKPIILNLIQDYRGWLNTESEQINDIVEKTINRVSTHSEHLNISKESCEELFK